MFGSAARRTIARWARGEAAPADALRSQVADFTGLVDRLRLETTGFGRDLAASVDALGPAAAAEVLRVTAVMLARVQAAETRLEKATSEAAALRTKLEQAQEDARADPLTGLANRRGLSEAFAAQLQTGAGACLAVCDIDHFKQINDRFGHAVGDRVLAAMAATLADACPDALVARYGGEEFALLFPDDDLDRAVAAVNGARASVAVKRYRLRDTDAALGQITFSGGVVATGPGEAFDDAFGRADVLLYEAKRSGRNCILP